MQANDRDLLSWSMESYTKAGWEIVSHSEIGFQARLPHRISAIAVALLVMAPALFGMFAWIFLPVAAVGLLSFALICAMFLVLHHLTMPAKLMYVSARQLRQASQQQMG